MPGGSNRRRWSRGAFSASSTVHHQYVLVEWIDTQRVWSNTAYLTVPGTLHYLWARLLSSCATHVDQVILASDTVYPGKPLSDTEAFFVMVADLLVRSSVQTADCITHSRSFVCIYTLLLALLAGSGEVTSATV